MHKLKNTIQNYQQIPTHDDSINNTNALPKAPHLPNNHPLSLVSQNFRNLAIRNPPNLRPSHIQSPIQHIVTQHPTPPLFSLKKIIFLANDEQTNWITPPIKLPPSQLPKSTPYYPTFCFSAT